MSDVTLTIDGEEVSRLLQVGTSTAQAVSDTPSTNPAGGSPAESSTDPAQLSTFAKPTPPE